MEIKYEYEHQKKYAEYQKYNPIELVKSENSRLLLDVINEAKKSKDLQQQLSIANDKLKDIENFMQETARAEAEHGFFDSAGIHIFAQLQGIIKGDDKEC